MGAERARGESVEAPSVAASGRGSRRLRSRLKRLIPRSLAIQRLQSSPHPTVLLTFDDGPHPEITPAVLQRLERHNARAVFFVVGRRARRASALLERIQRAGHVIGNHSHLHRTRDVLAGPQTSLLRYYRDVARCRTIIERGTGTRATLFRPPGGWITPATLLTPRLLGMRCVLWTREVQDWSFRTDEDARVGAEKLLQVVAPDDIVLLHDFNPCILVLLDTLLPGLRDRGYDLASGVDRL